MNKSSASCIYEPRQRKARPQCWVKCSGGVPSTMSLDLTKEAKTAMDRRILRSAEEVAGKEINLLVSTRRERFSALRVAAAFGFAKRYWSATDPTRRRSDTERL